jgi:hypothetical protein
VFSNCQLKGYLQLQDRQQALEASTKVVAQTQETESPSARKSSPGQAVLSLSEFLKSLATAGADGRIIQDGKVLKFLLLKASNHFSDIVSSAR